VAAETRILARYLEALEAGDYKALPGGEAQVQGFLRRYAAFLGLPPDEAISRYRQDRGIGQAEAAPPTPVPRPTTPAAEAKTPPPGRRAPSTTAAPLAGKQTSSRAILFAMVAGIVVGLIALRVVGGTWAWSRFRDRPAATAAATAVAPPTSATGAPPGTETSLSPQTTPTFAASASGGITLALELTEHAWVRVTVDGFTAFEGLLEPGLSETWTADEMVIAETGNGAAVIAVVNGQPQGVLGGRGEICARGWGPGGELDVPPPPTPAPANTPTP
jgi:hypothetical protein